MAVFVSSGHCRARSRAPSDSGYLAVADGRGKMTYTLRCLPVGFRRAMCFGPAMLAVLLVSLTTVSLADAQTLQVYAGAIAEPSEDLPWALQELALDPPFDNDVKS